MSNWKKRVLIMEDNTELASSWKQAFELNDCDVTVCHNGDEAARFLTQETFDLVITDLLVPDQKGGIFVLTKLFTMGVKAPPAIAVTGHSIAKFGMGRYNVFLDQASRLGASASLQKPFPCGELVAMAQSLWDAPEIERLSA